jgi:5-methylcytosine-specific restriction enzyme subunit McrC
MREPIRVFEHETLRVGDRGFTEKHFSSLVLYNERHGDRFFVVGHKRIKFASYVGVIQVKGLAIEVLPKADRHEDGDRSMWRDVLIDMLQMCGYLNVESTSPAHLRLRRASLFELYLESFLSEVRSLVHQGLVKKYRSREENLTVLKGRIQFQKHIAKNLVHRERFYTAHETYDRNNPFNQILASAVDIVAQSACSVHVQGGAKSMALHFENVSRRRWTSKDFDRLQFDRNTERYRKATLLARLIILNYQPDIRMGRFDVLAILFDMNELFEEFVLHQLKKRGAALGLQVKGQRSAQFWQTDGMRKTIRPDIVISQVDETDDCAILDTKWKVPRNGRPDDADLKQMYTYNLQFGAPSSYLVYPQAGNRSDVNGHFIPPKGQPDLKHRCGMWYVDLLKNGRLRRDLGSDILNRIVWPEKDSETGSNGAGAQDVSV